MNINIEGVSFKEINCRNGNKILLLNYAGEDDPVRHLDDAVRQYVGRDNYTEFVDMSMDNPWVRIVVKGDNSRYLI